MENVIPSDHPERQRFQALFDKMSSNGVVFDKIKLQYYSENYRGVHSKVDIKYQDEIMMVPEQFIITMDLANKIEINKYIIENKKDMP